MARRPKPQLTFADAEFRAQGIALDNTLKAISDFLETEGELVDKVHQDLVRGLKRPATGRNGMTASRVLRSFILYRIKNWDLRELRERIADGFTLRLFTDFGASPIPSHQTFNRSFNRLTAETIRAVNHAVVRAAVDLGLEDGKRLRVDTTVVETDIHFPTDCTLLWDTVRVITRLAHRLQERVPSLSAFPDRRRRARRRSQEISRMSPKERQRQQKTKYRDIIRITREVIDNGHVLCGEARGVKGLDPLQELIVRGLVEQIQDFCDLGNRVVSQAHRRVFEEEKVAVEEKIFSIFEPHTDLIVRGKIQEPVEFGHKVFLAESGAGLVTEYQILKGNPSDEDHVESSLEGHRELFGTPPDLYAADRGFYNPDNVVRCNTGGVKMECIPLRGGKKTPEREAYEKSTAFKKGQRFRAGIEGRISVLFRGRGMKRCLREGLIRFEVFVGIAVLANNLLRIAALLEKRSARRKRIA
jgi:IS5 family transposase